MAFEPAPPPATGSDGPRLHCQLWGCSVTVPTTVYLPPIIAEASGMIRKEHEDETHGAIIRKGPHLMTMNPTLHPVLVANRTSLA